MTNRISVGNGCKHKSKSIKCSWQSLLVGLLATVGRFDGFKVERLCVEGHALLTDFSKLTK